MATPVRSRRAFGPTVLPASPTAVLLLYTVPADRTLILRSVLLANTGAGATLFGLWLNGGGTAQVIYFTSVPGQTTLAVLDDVILDPGDALYGRVGLGGTGNISGYGSLLDGAPS